MFNIKPKFEVSDCEKCSFDRVFKNGKCVYDNRLGFALSVDEIVEVLNHDNYQERVYDLVQNKIWVMQGKYNRTGDIKYKQIESILKELQDELYEPSHSSEKYMKILKEWFEEGKDNG